MYREYKQTPFTQHEQALTKQMLTSAKVQTPLTEERAPNICSGSPNDLRFSKQHTLSGHGVHQGKEYDVDTKQMGPKSEHLTSHVSQRASNPRCPKHQT